MSSVLLVSLCAFFVPQIFNSPSFAVITTHNLCPYFICHKEKCKSSEENCLISNFMIHSYQQPNAPQLITGQSFSVLCIYFLPPVPGPHCSLHHQFHSLLFPFLYYHYVSANRKLILCLHPLVASATIHIFFQGIVSTGFTRTHFITCSIPCLALLLCSDLHVAKSRGQLSVISLFDLSVA